MTLTIDNSQSESDKMKESPPTSKDLQHFPLEKKKNTFILTLSHAIQKVKTMKKNWFLQNHYAGTIFFHQHLIRNTIQPLICKYQLVCTS